MAAHPIQLIRTGARVLEPLDDVDLVLRGPDGGPTTVKNAMFGFAPEFTIGTTSGSPQAFGPAFEPAYGEQSAYVFSSEQTAGAVTGRG
ncbi:MAG TPA: hypothetical protein VFF37_00670 [Streptomyces sp.]|nr:hypothetical protein [Streptomyces sp.]